MIVPVEFLGKSNIGGSPVHEERYVKRPVFLSYVHALLRASVICVFRGRGEKKTRFRGKGISREEVETCWSSSRFLDHIRDEQVGRLYGVLFFRPFDDHYV